MHIKVIGYIGWRPKCEFLFSFCNLMCWAGQLYSYTFKGLHKMATSLSGSSSYSYVLYQVMVIFPHTPHAPWPLAPYYLYFSPSSLHAHCAPSPQTRPHLSLTAQPPTVDVFENHSAHFGYTSEYSTCKRLSSMQE